ncbi:MAG TPA: hypothetical protein VHX16_02715, partial [Chloroflexota bacterium]|nr:hypothetical protein [Chloroflexota bacterium]
MADIVLGIGSARSPLTSLPPDRWAELAERDKYSVVLFELDGSPVSYETLLARAPDLSRQLDPALWKRQYETAQRDFDALYESIQRAAPDVLVIMGDDEEELHHADNRPGILVHLGDKFRVMPRPLPNRQDEINETTNWTWGDHDAVYPGAPELSLHLLKSLMADEFDLSITNQLPMDRPISHGFGFVFTRLARRMQIPTVAFFMNIHYPPNRLSPRRCWRFGQAVRRGIEQWPGNERVAVIGTGGLSTGVLREDMDRLVLRAMAERDEKVFDTMPHEWVKGPAGEILA